MNEKCPAKIYKGFSSYTCGRNAQYEYEGSCFCKTHHPPTVKEKCDARTDKWNAAFRESSERNAQARASQQETERRASHYEELLSSLKSAVQIIGHPDDAMTVHFKEVIAKALK